MIGEECKFLHPAPCKKYKENPERSCRAHAKATIPNSTSILRPQGDVTTIGASEYISKAQFKVQTNPTCDPGSKYNSPNYKSTTRYDRETKSGL